MHFTHELEPVGLAAWRVLQEVSRKRDRSGLNPTGQVNRRDREECSAPKNQVRHQRR